MVEDWKLIYRSTEEYKAEIIKQLLTDNGLHPVLLDHKDSEFGLGEAEIYISPLELVEAKRVMEENENLEN